MFLSLERSENDLNTLDLEDFRERNLEFVLEVTLNWCVFIGSVGCNRFRIEWSVL